MLKNILFILPVFLLNISSCGFSQEILGLSRQEAKNRLKKGDITFILESELPTELPAALTRLESLTKINTEAPFYAGLLAESSYDESSPAVKNRSLLLFALALKSKSAPVRREAAEKLTAPCLETQDMAFIREVLSLLGNKADGDTLNLRAACLYRTGRFGDLSRLANGKAESYGRIIPLIGALRDSPLNDREKIEWEIKDFFFGSPIDRSWEWALAEIKRLQPAFFEPGEDSIVLGRAAVNRSAYAQGLRLFQAALEEASVYTPEKYFFPYPELITGLGRAFQFTPQAQADGADLFDTWISAAGTDHPLSLYRLFYYAGRIERQRQGYQASSAKFMEAVKTAPDSLQKDACIWYILMNSLASDPDTTASLLKDLIPLMSSPPYFTDVMERLCRHLVSAGRLDTMLEVFDLLKEDHHAAASQYGWILGRVIQEGRFAADRSAEDFFKIAFEEGNASLYYRAMSASQLKAPLIPVEASKKSNKNAKLSKEIAQEAKFILDFFEFGAGNFALPYIKRIEDELPYSELRKVAKALGDNGEPGESLSLVARYMEREDYVLDREDLHLYYPRHFQEIVETNAEKAGISAEILFGLIRTESAFMPEVVSRSGAIGLGQIMQDTGLEMAGRIARREGVDYRIDGEIDLKDPEINAHISAYYLSYLIDYMGGSPMLALLAYNGGMGRVNRWRNANNAGAKLPEDLFLETIEFTETREYGRRVLAAAAMYGWLYYDMNMDAVVADIYR